MPSLDTTEQQRQYYLEAMGISTWLPTAALPAAAQSPEWVWHEEKRVEEPNDSVKQVTQPASISAPTVQSSTPSTKPLSALPPRATSPEVDDIGESSAKPIEVNQSEKTTAVTETGQQPPRFRMAMVAFSDCLAIVQLPMDVLQALAPEHQRLIKRILSSVGLGLNESDGDGNIQLFAWPIVNNLNVDQSLTLAQAAIHQLEKRLSADQLPLVIFGEQMVEYLGLPEGVVGHPQNCNSRPVIQSPTLNELMSIPGLKRELWVQLQQFKTLL